MDRHVPGQVVVSIENLATLCAWKCLLLTIIGRIRAVRLPSGLPCCCRPVHTCCVLGGPLYLWPPWHLVTRNLVALLSVAAATTCAGITVSVWPFIACFVLADHLTLISFCRSWWDIYTYSGFLFPTNGRVLLTNCYMFATFSVNYWPFPPSSLSTAVQSMAVPFKQMFLAFYM